MAHNPMPTLVFILSSRLLVAVVTATVSSTIEFEPCQGVVDFLTGCDDTISLILSVALGAIPGIPDEINFLIATISNAALIWSILTWGRGN